jgi:hypothetical protein
MSKTLDRSLLASSSIIGAVASIDLYRTSWAVLDTTQGMLRLAPSFCMMAFGLAALFAIATGLAVVVATILDIVADVTVDERDWNRTGRRDALEALQAHQDKRLAQGRASA